jgi:CubicO group peptidase (beta-lactamase class C family)
VAITLGIAASLGALVWWATFGPDSKIVNASYPLLILTGCAFVGLLLAARPLSQLTGRPQRLARFLGSKALSIYLWQGFGLLAADRLVTRQGIGGAPGVLAALFVVVVVTTACVGAFGWIEDLAARRPTRLPRLEFLPVAAAALACLVLAAALRPAVDSDESALPPSGQAVVARGERIPDQLRKSDQGGADSGHGRLNSTARSGDPKVRIQAALDEWVKHNRDTLQSLGSRRIDVAVADASGSVVDARWSKAERRPDGVQPWWSMSKVVTTAWLTRLVDQGTVTLDDRLSKYLPSVPHGDAITLEDLARHQSGIPSEFDRTLDNANPREELEDWFADPRLEFQPGTGFAYSRVGYYLLAWALEEASGTAWNDVVRDLGTQAGVQLVVDEDIEPTPEPTHPGAGTYRGHLWSSGGILATADDSARFFRWLMTDGVSPTGRSAMATFANDKTSWFYGLALLPLCPCDEDGRWLRSSRYGLDSLIGTWAFDENTTATVFIDPDNWFTDEGPRPEFYELEASLLDAAS